MEIKININEEIAKDYQKDKFEYFFDKVVDEIGCDGLFNNYGTKIAIGLQRAFILSEINNAENTENAEDSEGAMQKLKEHENRIQELQGLDQNNIVKHFKYETLTETQKADYIYVYQIIDTNVKHTETGERLVAYKAMYDGKKYGLDVEYGQIFVRPYDMFFSKVDKKKYPNIKQEYRFQKFI